MKFICPNTTKKSVINRKNKSIAGGHNGKRTIYTKIQKFFYLKNAMLLKKYMVVQQISDGKTIKYFFLVVEKNMKHSKKYLILNFWKINLKNYLIK